MKKRFFIACFIAPITLFAQTTVNQSSISILAGYGSQGFNLRGDVNISDWLSLDVSNGSTRLYLDFGIDGYQFDQSVLTFNSFDYPSDARVITLGLGGGEEFLFNKLSIYPFLGLRYYYGRFTDADLVDAIGTYSLQRYIYDQYGSQIPIGPMVDNGYGDVISFDLGSSLGYRVSRLFEIGALVSFSPMKFSSSSTMFGKYWAEPPYTNEYYIKISPVRLEGGIRLHFGY